MGHDPSLHLWMCMRVCMYEHMCVCKLIPSWGRQMGVIGHENTKQRLTVVSALTLLTAWGYKGTPMYAMQQLLSRALLSKNKCGKYLNCSFLVLGELLLCGYLHPSSSVVQYRQKEGQIAAGQANLAEMSVCKSLAPRRCRLFKHTNITTAVKVLATLYVILETP